MDLQLDDLDRSILAVLQRDGRTPAAQIAEEIGLSRPAVADRIEKLERSGVLLGIAALVHPQALGNHVTAFVSARRTARMDAKAEKAFKDMMTRDEVREVHTVAGDDCYLIKIVTDSIDSLNDIVSWFLEPPLSMSTRTTIVMKTHCEKFGGLVRSDKRVS